MHRAAHRRRGWAILGYWRLLLTAIVLVLLVYFVLTLIFSAKLRWQLLRRIAQVLLVVLLFYLITQPADRHARAVAASAAGTPTRRQFRCPLASRCRPLSHSPRRGWLRWSAWRWPRC